MVFNCSQTPSRYFDNIRVNQKAEVPDWKIKFWNVVWKYTSPLLMVVILFSSTVLLILKPLLYDVYIDVSSSNDIHCLHCVWSSALCYLDQGSGKLVDVALLIESKPIKNNSMTVCYAEQPQLEG